MLEDSEYKDLVKIKNGISWHDFIVILGVHASESIKRGDLELFKKEVKDGNI